MSETEINQSRVEAFLSTPQFLRSFEVLAVYQRLLQENAADPEQQELIRQRMHDHLEHHGNEESEEERSQTSEEFKAIRQQVFDWCEKGELTKEKIATLMAGCSVADNLLESYNHKPGRRADSGNMMVNDTIEYSGGGPEQDYISINIVPSSARNFRELMERVNDGFHKLAHELKVGELKHIQEVVMTSWLLGPAFADKIQAFLGKDVKIEDTDEDEEVVEQIRNLALSFNKRSVEEYLSAGKLPQVRTVKMTKEEFVAKFS